MFDLGTGLRFWGDTVRWSSGFRATSLVTHLHWDHVQGLPFFHPILRPGGTLTVYAPPQDGVSVGEAFADFVRPPYFPVHLTELLGEVEFRETDGDSFSVGAATVTSAPVPHVGATNGYRVDVAGVSVVYISDHQEPADGSGEVSPAVLDLCRGADLLIHDAQYTPDEFLLKSDWGHCTADFAARVAVESGVRRLALFHHDPSHDDAAVDGIAEVARRLTAGSAVEEVLVAQEGLTVVLSPAAAAATGGPGL